MVISLLAAVVFVIAGCAGISTYPDSVKFTQNGEVYYSNEAIARNKDVIQKYGGIMTDEKVQRIIDDFHLEEAILVSLMIIVIQTMQGFYCLVLPP